MSTNQKPQPREIKDKPTKEAGDARRVPRKELAITATMRMACDNCNYTTNAKGESIIVCSGRCVVNDPTVRI